MLADPQSPASIRWEKRNPIPYDHKRSLTKSITIGDAVYIGFGASVVRYKPHLDQWESLPDSNLFQYNMAEVNGQLVLVEDAPLRFFEKRSPTCSRIVVWDETTRTYTTPYPILPEVRQLFSAVGYQHYLIIMGGIAKGYNVMPINSVEILDTRERKWYPADKLPWRFQISKAICVDDTVVVMGGISTWGGSVKKIASAPLLALISQAKSANPENGSTSIWTELPDMPLYNMVPLSSRNKFLLVHGSTSRMISMQWPYTPVYNWSKLSSEVFMLDPSIDKWVVLGKIPESYCSVCAILPSGELFTAGVKNYFSLKKQCLDQVYIGHLPFN